MLPLLCGDRPFGVQDDDQWLDTFAERDLPK